MKALVTGGSGFVGQHITRRLISEGYEVSITSTGNEVEISGVEKIFYHSLAEINWKEIENSNFEVVIHQMANNDTRCMDRSEMFRTNLESSQQLFSAAARGGCRNFVYASSTAIYGDSPAPYLEYGTPIRPLTPYAESKKALEEFAEDFSVNNPEVSCIGLRYCNVYGPGEDQKGRRMSMVGQILRKMLRGESPRLFAPGDQKRDWVYVMDVVEMNMLAMDAGFCSIGNAVYNVGNGNSYTFNEIVSIINELTNQSIETDFVPCPFPEEYQDHTECNIEKAQQELGFFPRFDLRSGIQEYLKDLNGNELSTLRTR